MVTSILQMNPEILLKEFGIVATEIKSLDGCASINYNVTTSDAVYILKYYKNPRELELIQGEMDSILAVQDLVESDFPLFFFLVQLTRLKISNEEESIMLLPLQVLKVLFNTKDL